MTPRPPAHPRRSPTPSRGPWGRDTAALAPAHTAPVPPRTPDAPPGTRPDHGQVHDEATDHLPGRPTCHRQTPCALGATARPGNLPQRGALCTVSPVAVRLGRDAHRASDGWAPRPPRLDGLARTGRPNTTTPVAHDAPPATSRRARGMDHTRHWRRAAVGAPLAWHGAETPARPPRRAHDTGANVLSARAVLDTLPRTGPSRWGGRRRWPRDVEYV